MRRDEHYILDICDKVLGLESLRQHRFDFLRGDSGRRLPVDAYYLDLDLVIEYRERQHVESIRFWDQKETVSGVPRGRQREIYDQRRRVVLPAHGIDLVELDVKEFVPVGSNSLHRDVDTDTRVIETRLRAWG